MRHARIKRSLSAYLDRQLAQEELQLISLHVDTCRTCRQQLREIQLGKAAGTFFKEPTWDGGEKLWESIQREKTSFNADTGKALEAARLIGRLPSFLGLRPAFTLGIIFLLLLGNLFFSFRPQKFEYLPARVDRTPVYAFDFGLLLEALAAGAPTDRFELRYEGQSSTYESASSQIPFKLASFSRVPKPFRLQEVRLLKSACCRSVQFVCWKMQKCILIFQQPKGHPITFGTYPLEKVSYNDRFVHRVEAGEWTALTWEGEDSQFVAVGELSAADLFTILQSANPI